MGKKNKNVYVCEYCGSNHDGSYGSGRFCSNKCARKYSQTHITEDGRRRQIESLNSKENREKIRDTRKKHPRSVTKNNDKIEEETSLKISSNKKYKNKQRQLGKIGEVRIIQKCLEHDIPVYVPVVDTGVDLIMDINHDLKKVQVKSSTHTSGVNSDKINFPLQSMKRRFNSEDKSYYNERDSYDNDIDYFGLYDAVHDKSYMIENTGKHSITISNGKTGLNCYDKNSNFSEYCDIDSVLENLKDGNKPNDIIDSDYTEIT